MSALERELERIAAASTLLVASDFDGTLSPIVNDPAIAAPLEPAVHALVALADLPGTHVAVVSGRGLDDLRSRARVPGHVHLIGGHGAEVASLPGLTLPPARAALRERLLSELARIAESAAGFVVEPKPASVAFHYRNAAPEAANRAVDRIRRLAARAEGVSVMEGKKVIELAVAEGDKGTALRRLARSLGADAVFYVGDDVTDEDAFAILGPDDLGIKVGEGPTAATVSIEDPAAVAAVLERLHHLRSTRVG